MPIAFRCTRCRAKLHVPSRWGGASVACPKCTTRVMVPGSEPPGGPTTFEQRGVERSLEALQATAGGIFAAESFELPEQSDVPSPEPAAAVPAAHLLVPGWTIYAGIAALAITAVMGFAAGVWWAG